MHGDRARGVRRALLLSRCGIPRLLVQVRPSPGGFQHREALATGRSDHHGVSYTERN